MQSCWKNSCMSVTINFLRQGWQHLSSLSSSPGQKRESLAWRILLAPLIVALLAQSVAAASNFSILEYPQSGSFQSGIGLVQGWSCNAKKIIIEIDGVAIRASYGVERPETAFICDDTDNGFALLVNWNLLGDGTHRLRALADKEVIGDVTFTVTTLGAAFLSGVSGNGMVNDFPTAGEHVNVQWEEVLQNFVITGGAGGGEGNSGGGEQVLLSPQPGSVQSGVGLIYGFVCEADRIDVHIDGFPLFGTGKISYGFSWTPSLSVCGDDDNGFAVRMNWTVFSAGVHRVQVFADGVEFADATFTISPFGSHFIRDVTGDASIENFPWADSTVHIRWQVEDQNFVIDRKSGLLSGAATPVDQNVVVSPIDARTGTTPLTLTFAEVTHAGDTSLVTSNVGLPPPTGFKLGTPPIYYELATTATFSGPFSVCVDYSGVDFPDETQLAFFHFEHTAWIDRTLSHDLATKRICASVASLSPFAIFVPDFDNTASLLRQLHDDTLAADISAKKKTPLIKLTDSALLMLDKGTANLGAGKVKKAISSFKSTSRLLQSYGKTLIRLKDKGVVSAAVADPLLATAHTAIAQMDDFIAGL